MKQEREIEAIEKRPRSLSLFPSFFLFPVASVFVSILGSSWTEPGEIRNTSVSNRRRRPRGNTPRFAADLLAATPITTSSSSHPTKLKWNHLPALVINETGGGTSGVKDRPCTSSIVEFDYPGRAGLSPGFFPILQDRFGNC